MLAPTVPGQAHIVLVEMVSISFKERSQRTTLTTRSLQALLAVARIARRKQILD